MSDAVRRGPSRASGHAALLMVQLCFGLMPLFGKWAFGGFAPRVVAGWRIVAGALVLGLLAGLVHGRAALPRRADLPRLAACALLGVACNMVLFLEGLERSTAVDAGLIISLIPAFTFLAAILARQETFSVLRGLGILVAFAGTFLLLGQQGFDLANTHLAGNLLMVANMVSYSVYLVWSRPLVRRYPPLVVIAWVYLLATWTLPFVMLGESAVPAHATSREWLSLAWILAFPTVAAYLMNLFALSRLRASTVASYVFLQPLIAGVSGVVLLGEALARGTLAAAGAIFVGLGLVVFARR